MSQAGTLRLRYSVHGVNVEIASQVPSLLEAMGRTIGEFAMIGTGVSPNSSVSGIIRPFNQGEVLKYLSPTATRISGDNDLVEIYEEGERFWLIDDHWGLCEINILKSQWRAWVLPEPTANPLRVIEQAVLWPMSQLMRPRGLCLLPAASVVRDGWGAMLLSNFNIEPELNALVHAGWRVVGQTWTALRDHAGRVEMLQMPGALERTTPRAPGLVGTSIMPQRVDLTSEYPGSACHSADCDAVVLVAPGRRPLPRLTPIAPTNALGAIRNAWPIAELHPRRRQGALAGRLAQRCSVFDAQLSRNPQDMLSLLQSAQRSRFSRPLSAVNMAATAA